MVYLIHFHQKLKHAQHYIGWSSDMCNFKLRIKHHQNGSGARLMTVIKQAGITWEVARIWKQADKGFERHLKNMKKSSDYCPVCRINRRIE